VLIIPPNDWVQHKIPSRFHHIFGRLSEKKDYEVFVLRYLGIPTASKGSLGKVACKKRINFVGFNSLPLKDLSMYYLFNLGSLSMKMLTLLKDIAPDVIIHGNVLPSAVAVMLGKRYNIPTIFDYLDHFPESALIYCNNPIKKHAAYSVVSEITKFNIKHSSIVVTVSDYLANMIRKIDPEKKIVVLPNGVDLNCFKPMKKEKALKETELEWLANKKVVVYAGSIEPWVDLEIVLKVLKKLVKKDLDIHLLLVGWSHSSYANKVTQLVNILDIEKHVTVTGFVPYAKVPYYINAADVAVAPYKAIPKNEVTPLKILEYMACGKTTLTTSIGEIVKRFGKYLAVYKDERDLENKLRVALNVGENQHSLVNEIRGFLSRNYSWDHISEVYDELLQCLNTKIQNKGFKHSRLDLCKLRSQA
jgi:glycosyltransferase involved in cell wall biosynthesis